jgi:hypothetical protein
VKRYCIAQCKWAGNSEISPDSPARRLQNKYSPILHNGPLSDAAEHLLRSSHFKRSFMSPISILATDIVRAAVRSKDVSQCRRARCSSTPIR